MIVVVVAVVATYVAVCILGLGVARMAAREPQGPPELHHVVPGDVGPIDFLDNCPHCADRTPQVEVQLPRGHFGQLCLRCGLVAQDPRRIALSAEHPTPREGTQP